MFIVKPIVCEVGHNLKTHENIQEVLYTNPSAKIMEWHFLYFFNDEAYNLVHFYGDPRGIIESIIERTQDRWKKRRFLVDVRISYQRKYEES